MSGPNCAAGALSDVEDGICYVALQEEHAAAAKAALSLAFHVGEPTTSVLGVQQAAHEAFFELFTAQMVGNGLSVAAVDAETGAFAGCFIAEDFAAPPPAGAESFADEHPGFAPLFGLLDEAEEQLKAAHGIAPGTLPPPGRFCHLWCVAVDGAFGRRGIGGKLADRVLGRAAAAGYGASFAEATGHFSARLLEKAGMAAEHEIAYATWSFEGGVPLQACPPPHVGTRVMVVRHGPAAVPVSVSALEAALSAPVSAPPMERGGGDGDGTETTETCWWTYDEFPRQHMLFDEAQQKWFKDEDCARRFAAREAAQPRSSASGSDMCCCGQLRTDFAYETTTPRIDGTLQTVWVCCWGMCFMNPCNGGSSLQ